MGLFDALKSAANILKEAGKIEQYQQILEVQKELLEMQNKIGALESENKNLQEKLRIKENLIYEKNAYWISKGDKKEGPFCQRCWDKNKDLIRISMAMKGPRLPFCPECKNYFQASLHP